MPLKCISHYSVNVKRFELLKALYKIPLLLLRYSTDRIRSGEDAQHTHNRRTEDAQKTHRPSANSAAALMTLRKPNRWLSRKTHKQQMAFVPRQMYAKQLWINTLKTPTKGFVRQGHRKLKLFPSCTGNHPQVKCCERTQASTF